MAEDGEGDMADYGSAVESPSRIELRRLGITLFLSIYLLVFGLHPLLFI